MFECVVGWSDRVFDDLELDVDAVAVAEVGETECLDLVVDVGGRGVRGRGYYQEGL